MVTEVQNTAFKFYCNPIRREVSGQNIDVFQATEQRLECGTIDSYRLARIFKLSMLHWWSCREPGEVRSVVSLHSLLKLGNSFAAHSSSSCYLCDAQQALMKNLTIAIKQRCSITVLLIFSVGMVRLRLPQLTMLNIDSTYCLPDIAYRLPGCPLLESVVFRTLRTPPRNEEFWLFFRCKSACNILWFLIHALAHQTVQKIRSHCLFFSRTI